MRRCFTLILSFQLLLTSSHSWASQQSPSTEASESALALQLQQRTQLWTQKKEDLVPDLLAAAERLANYTENLEKSRGAEYVKNLLDANQLIIFDEIIDTEISYRIIDEVRVPRIILNNEAYLIIDENILPKKSKHLEQYISRLFFDARKKGMSVNLVVLNNGEINVEHLVKPKVTEWRWWREYFISKYKNPSFNDFTLALFNGVALQGTLTMAMSWLKYNIQGTEINTIPTLWTMAYSVVYGTFISAIRNWTVLSGSKLTRVLKSQTISMLYAYGLVMAVGHGDFSDRLATISIFTLEGLALNVSVLANGLMNNYVKDYWNQIPRLRELTRVNAGHLTYKTEWLNKWFGWRKSSVEGQLLYLIPWSINVLSLMTMATTNWLHIPGTSISVPIFQLASIPFAMYWSKVYSKKLAKRAEQQALDEHHAQIWAQELNETATEYDQAWRNTFGMKVREIPQRAVEGVNKLAQKVSATVKKCVDFLKID